ncbi:MAG: ABC transporter ATP-binding protein [Pseudomonadales bacterium]|nr:ABC transporter ATP-binding protein [Pseudomonadales bacterium]
MPAQKPQAAGPEMTQNRQPAAGSAPVIRLRQVCRAYKYYARELDRVKEILTGKPRYRETLALADISLDVAPGEVLGIVGKNGAGKSTLLKMLANTLQPSSGTLHIEGRVAALLELGASFHPEMTGHENIYLNCAILGLNRAQTDRIYEQVVSFSGIGEFIQRPVKTYSSGMFVRLAFAIATHIEPDILIIDEALSVGDGAFARKSFDRIMAFKRAGKTILFCSHSLYQIESICDRVLWLEQGRMQALGKPAEVVTAYGESLRNESPNREALGNEYQAQSSHPASAPVIPVQTETRNDSAHERKSDDVIPAQAGTGESAQGPSADPPAMPRILDIQVLASGMAGKVHHLLSGVSDLMIQVSFSAPAALPMASVAVAFSGGDGRILASAGTVNDGVEPVIAADGSGHASILFPGFPLLKGKYNVDVYLMCEKGLHIYETVIQAAELNVEQHGLARGLVDLPHQWQAS